MWYLFHVEVYCRFYLARPRQSIFTPLRARLSARCFDPTTSLAETSRRASLMMLLQRVLLLSASVSALRMGGLTRVRSPCMVIEPEIYRECAIYDFEMEEKMQRLEEVVIAAKDAAMAANSQMELVSKEKAYQPVKRAAARPPSGRGCSMHSTAPAPVATHGGASALAPPVLRPPTSVMSLGVQASLEAALTEQDKKLEKLSLEVQRACTCSPCVRMHTMRVLDARSAYLDVHAEPQQAVHGGCACELGPSMHGVRTQWRMMHHVQVADEREETSYLRENLQKQAASAAAASSLEIEVSRMLRQLDEQGVAAATQLKSETTSLRALLDDQSSAATKARSDAERAEAVKSELREEIDARIIEASEARKMAERLSADLEATQEKSDDYLKAIEQIARVAATFTSTNTVTVNE